MSIKEKQLYYVQEDFTAWWGGEFFKGSVLRVNSYQGIVKNSPNTWIVALLKGQIKGDEGRMLLANPENPGTVGIGAKELLDHCIHVLDVDYVHPADLTDLLVWLR